MSLVGEVGQMAIATKGESGAGEVTLGVHGKYLAWSKEPISIGARVMVTAEGGIRTVFVQPIDL